MSTPESRAREAYDEAQRSKISGPSLVKPDGMARESQGEVDQLRTELARLQSRLEECEKGRDELKQDGESLELELRENIERLCNQRDEAEGECFKVNAALSALRALVAKKDEALKTCLEMFREIRGDWTDPRMECRAGADAAVAALALTPADCAGMECVPTGELAELRRDKERMDWLAGTFNSVVSDMYAGGIVWAVFGAYPKIPASAQCPFEKYDSPRAAIDAARRAGGNET